MVAVGLSAGGSEVLQFGPNGQNMGFGSDGAISAAVADPLLAIQPDGQIDLSGNADSSHYVLQQYTANGANLDWTTGLQTGQVGAMAIEPSGRIVDAVMTGANTWSLQGFFPANGAADAAFDEVGQISAMTGASAALAVQPNGDILLGGQAASDAFFSRYGADSAAAAVAEPDAAVSDLSLTIDNSAIPTGGFAYGGGDTDDGGAASGVEVEGSFADDGTTAEAHVVTITWGDGSQPAIIDLDATETSFSYPLPQYANAGPYTVQVTVADADGTNAVTQSFNVNYTNSQPSGLTVSLDNPTIATGGELTLSGSFNDPQSNLAHLVTIDWGDVVGGRGHDDVNAWSRRDNLPSESEFQQLCDGGQLQHFGDRHRP